jgi:hypothetical protein
MATKRQFLAQVTNQQVFVDASYWVARTVRIVSDNLSGVNGFGKHAWKPASSM